MMKFIFIAVTALTLTTFVNGQQNLLTYHTVPSPGVHVHVHRPTVPVTVAGSHVHPGHHPTVPVVVAGTHVHPGHHPTVPVVVAGNHVHPGPGHHPTVPVTVAGANLHPRPIIRPPLAHLTTANVVHHQHVSSIAPVHTIPVAGVQNPHGHHQSVHHPVKTVVHRPAISVNPALAVIPAPGGHLNHARAVAYSSTKMVVNKPAKKHGYTIAFAY